MLSKQEDTHVRAEWLYLVSLVRIMSNGDIILISGCVFRFGFIWTQTDWILATVKSKCVIASSRQRSASIQRYFFPPVEIIDVYNKIPETLHSQGVSSESSKKT